MSGPVEIADVFISHASEDKAEIARPLAEALRRKGLTVWYDEFVLRLGDSLRLVIDRGLGSCRFGIVILSPAFFSKEWPQRELNGLLARETHKGSKVLLPVWHRIGHDEVLQFSPMLADKLAVSTDRGLESVVEQILAAIGQGASIPEAMVSSSSDPVGLSDHVIVFRYAPAVETLLDHLAGAGVPSLVLESDEALARRLIKRGKKVVLGDFNDGGLEAAHLRGLGP